MSQMSQIRKVKKDKDQRLLIIKDFIGHESPQQIADRCGVTRRTFYRDFNEWRDSGGFREWLYTEFLILHPDITKETRYKELSKMIQKDQVVRQETTIKGEIKIERTSLAEYLIRRRERLQSKA